MSAHETEIHTPSLVQENFKKLDTTKNILIKIEEHIYEGNLPIAPYLYL